MKKVAIFDSTLRDGAQGEGISFSASDKLKIVRTLDKLGVAYIEAGNPASNPKDSELFELLAKEQLKNARICAFGSTRRKDVRIEDDPGAMSLLAAGTPVVCMVGKASIEHVKSVLETTPQENLTMISDTVSFFKRHGREVIFDAEHFFDGYKLDADYAMASLRAAAEAGADVLCLCDTNGAAYFCDVFDITRKVVQAFPSVRTGIHAHNDCGLAVANSMAAADAGATHIQGTLIGFGERCGNANLSTIIPDLQLKRGYDCIPKECLAQLTGVCRKVADVANFVITPQKPYIGSGAFAHKGGMHVSGVLKKQSSFEHIPPEAVGNNRRFLTSEVSGRATVLKKIDDIAPRIGADSPEVIRILEKLKEMEYRGYQFEAAEESFELLIRRELGMTKKFFELEYFKIIGEQPRYRQIYPSSALIKVRVDGQSEITAAEGDGPVHALDLALRKALSRFYPKLAKMRLTDFKVRVIESDATTAATVRVLIDSSDDKRHWCTVGVSTDIIEASFLALSDSVEYKILMDYGLGEEI